MAKKNFNIFGVIFAVLGIAGVAAGVTYLKNNETTEKEKTSTNSEQSSGEDDATSLISDLKITIYDRNRDVDSGIITFEYIYNVIGTKSALLTYSFESQLDSSYLTVRMKPVDKIIYVDVINPFSGEKQINFVTDTNVKRSIFVNLYDFSIAQIEPESPVIVF